MASLTLTIEEDLLRQARIRALEQGTSVNALVREWLRDYANTGQRSAAQGFLAVAKRSRASSGAAGRAGPATTPMKSAWVAVPGRTFVDTERVDGPVNLRPR
jgi:plasmid stability protein